MKIETSLNWAYKSGYRHFDTATFYKNENLIGIALKRLKIKREEIFITSKVWFTDVGDPEK